MAQFFDALTLDQSMRICADGCLVAEAFAARTGLQDYLGAEVDPDNAHGLRDRGIVKVYRPESEVFKSDSLATYAAAPITIDHPSEPVTADNWRRLGVGEIHGDVVRDGQRVRVPVIVRDAAAVTAATTTHRQISMGYATNLVFPKDGKHPDGTTCDAYQTDIRINHFAWVPAARGGSELRIVDERPHSTHKENPAMPGTIIVDGLPVSLADEAAVRAVIAKKDAEIAAANTATADANTKLAEANGKVAALDAQLVDAKALVAPAAIDKLVADRSALIASAKAVVPTVAADGKTDAEIRRAVVTAKLGDKCPTEDAAVAGAFAVLTADAKPAGSSVVPIGAPMVAHDTGALVASMRNMRYA